MAVWENRRSRMASDAVLLLALVHIIVFCGTCDAQNSSAPPPPLDLTQALGYRPPIVNLRNQGGPVMWKPIHLYFVWYGTWSEPQKNAIRTAARSLTPTERIPQFPNLSNFWTTVTHYYQEPQSPGKGRKYVTNSVSLVKEVHNNYSMGKNLTIPTDALKIVLGHVGKGKGLPSDLEQGIYFLFAAGDVRFDVTYYCAYHDDECVDQSRIGSAFCNDTRNHIIYSFVPMPSDSNELNNACNEFRLYNLHHEALKDPTSPTTFNMYGSHGCKFIVALAWSLTNEGCAFQMEAYSHLKDHGLVIQFVTFGGRSPYPSSAGFILHYEGGY